MSERTWLPDPRCCWCGSHFEKTVIDNTLGYAFVCPTPECRARQDAKALIVGGKTINIPLPKQVEFEEAIESGRARRVYIGGALGGSKSHGVRYVAYRLCRNKRRFRVLLLRRTLEELKKHHIQEMELEQARLGEVKLSNANANAKLEFFETESFIQCGHCQHPKDVAIWLSTEYDLILLDELPTFEEDQSLRIMTRVGRTERPDGWPGAVGAAGNPGPAWIDELWIEKTRDREEYPDYDPNHYHFVHATLDDNPYMRAGYVNELADLPKDLREAWRFGKMGTSPTRFFREFNEKIHVRTEPLPAPLSLLGGLRWGFNTQGFYLLGIVLPDGRLHIIREYPFKGYAPSVVAPAVRHLTREFSDQYVPTYGHREMSDQGKGGEDLFVTLSLAGLPILHSSFEPRNGWQRVRDWLHGTIHGRPALSIDPACSRLIRQLRQADHDPDDPETIKDDPGRQEALQALVQIVMARPRPLAIGGKLPYPPESAGALLHAAMQDAARGR